MNALPMLAFLNPQRLWALLVLPLLILAYVLALRLKGRTGIRFPNTGILAAILPKQSRWRRHLAVAMTLCSLAALSVAWARPLGIEKVPRERATIIVVIDVSLSMQATDVKPDRMDAAKTAATNFVASLPSQYNVSIVSLSGNPAVLLPPSLDRTAAQRAIASLTEEDGTAIGDAIQASLSSLAQAPLGGDGKAAPGLIVLMSDGGNTTGQAPLVMAEKAATAKVPIDTIAYGTDNGYVDDGGKRYVVAPDRGTLVQIAQLTGGKSWTAESAGQLKDAYKSVGSDVGYQPVKKEITAQYAMYALAFAVIAALGAVSMAARWP